MKWLIGLSAVQTLLLVMLGLHAVKLDMRTDEIADTVEAINTAKQPASLEAENLQWPDAAPAQTVSAEDIRIIIREELEALAADGGAAAPIRRAATASSAPQQAAVYDKGQTLLTQSAIDQDLERFKKMNFVPPVEMDALHAKIAELPPEARRAALVRLTKAINSGEIKGQL